eukprot:CAMPEP_0184695370 /NCGR_PEP_ID=MMETSP0313-20130426/3021_1 /TAXON_ID=2792 /ORGANISM="Porphyridium aerugineum, Strain SAG 1380-2" /LENGTH=631 /DNA_ID=CAMNT_0027153807 /DNA_START=343 /DNA_END=2238 /DNA_ORIENTATION=-
MSNTGQPMIRDADAQLASISGGLQRTATVPPRHSPPWFGKDETDPSMTHSASWKDGENEVEDMAAHDTKPVVAPHTTAEIHAPAPGFDSADPKSRLASNHFKQMQQEVVLESSAVKGSEFPLAPEEVSPGRFIKLKLLGQGAVGKVYLVKLKDENRLYAMKVLTKDETVKRNRVQRVMTELEILATVNHPFLVTMYASIQTNTRLCFIMEFCEAGEFFRILQSLPKKRLNESQARFYAAEVILALEYLHFCGFIYRDLKPENILMKKNGHIALTDFDLSKQAEAKGPQVVQKKPQSLMMKMKGSFLRRADSSVSKLNDMDIVDSEPVMLHASTSFVGTEEYIAPEVVQARPQTAAMDWWTLGILIYEMLTGTTPFKGRNANQTYHNITHDNIHWPLDVHVSTECKQLVRKLLIRDPERRLGSHSGASEIKREKWFAGLNFSLIRNETPPILPRMKDPYDMSQYEGALNAFDESDEEDHGNDDDGESFEGGDHEGELDSGVSKQKSFKPTIAPEESENYTQPDAAEGQNTLTAAVDGMQKMNIEEEEFKMLSNQSSKNVAFVESQLEQAAMETPLDLSHHGSGSFVRTKSGRTPRIISSNSRSQSKKPSNVSGDPFFDFDTLRNPEDIERKY